MNKQMTQHTTIADVAKAAGVFSDYRFTCIINGRYDKMRPATRKTGWKKQLKTFTLFQPRFRTSTSTNSWSRCRNPRWRYF